jgi:xylulokinase
MSLLGIDIGTSGCKEAAFSEDGRLIAGAARSYPTLHPQPGYAELNSQDAWAAVQSVIAEVASQTHNDPVTALCAGSLGEAVVPVDADRAILRNTILFLDSRGAEYADALIRDWGQARFFEINPNLIGPQYSLPKILWMRDHEPEIYQKTDRFLLWGDLAGYLLGAEPFASSALANRTLLFDLDRNDWSDDLLAWAGLDRRRLGRVMPGGTVVGEVSATAAAGLGLPHGVQIVAGGHDQCVNALGCGAISAGQVVIGAGTVECLTPVYTRPSEKGKMLAAGLNIEHHVVPGLYVSFLFNQGGSLVSWFRRTFAPVEPGDSADVYDRLAGEMPASPTALLVLPHFEPPPWPEYIPDTAGMIVGLHTSTTRGEILKAIMEGVSLYFVEGLKSLKKQGMPITGLIASGGGAKSDAWLQIKADVYGAPVTRPVHSEAGLAGAAMLAGLGTGVYSEPASAVAAFVRTDRTFEPSPSRHAIYQERAALFAGLFQANRETLRALHSLTPAFGAPAAGS